MKRFYQKLEFSELPLEVEDNILGTSAEPIQEAKLEVEVDDYIVVGEANVSFD